MYTPPPAEMQVALFADDRTQQALAAQLHGTAFRIESTDNECTFIWMCKDNRYTAAIVVQGLAIDAEVACRILAKLHQSSDLLPCIIIGDTDDGWDKASDCGAACYLSFSQALQPGVLARHLSGLARRGSPSPVVAAPVQESKLLTPSSNPLTIREREVLEAMARYNNRSAVAAHLFISVKTVAAHLSSIYDKLLLTGTLRRHYKASEIALKNGWINAPDDDDGDDDLPPHSTPSPTPSPHTPNAPAGGMDTRRRSFGQPRLRRSHS